MPELLGLHHVTAIASAPQPNLDLCCGVLGLSLVKRTVNFDDPSTYHFYYGDASGTPGTLLTYFPRPRARRGQEGAGQTIANAFAVPQGALPAWRARLAALGVEHEELPPRFGEPVLRLRDPDGLEIELVEVGETTHAGEAVITRLHSVTLLVNAAAPTIAFLRDVMGLREAGSEGARTRLVMGAGAPAQRIDVLADPAAPPKREAAGSIHHVAFRAADDEARDAWAAHLAAHGARVSPLRDRGYFRSIYFREPGGVLFEIATDGPGFATDEPPDALGRALMLPAAFEPQRARIEAALPAIVVPPRA